MKNIKTYSPLRNAQHRFYTTLTLDGTVLDIGGNKGDAYQTMIKGNKKVFTTNIPGGHAADVLFDANEPFPIKDAEYDNVLCFNVLEHLHKAHVAIGEIIRITKKGGKVVVTVPFMYQIHGSPFDFTRMTPQYFEKRAEEFGFTIITEQHFAPGMFTWMFQVGGSIVPTKFLRGIVMWGFETTDKILSLMPLYKKLAARIPLGLCYVWQKN